jgi:hypothetical protein
MEMRGAESNRSTELAVAFNTFRPFQRAAGFVTVNWFGHNAVLQVIDLDNVFRVIVLQLWPQSIPLVN